MTLMDDLAVQREAGARSWNPVSTGERDGMFGAFVQLKTEAFQQAPFGAVFDLQDTRKRHFDGIVFLARSQPNPIFQIQFDLSGEPFEAKPKTN